MFYSLPHDLGLYLYDVLIGRFDLWVGFGIVAQMLFASRFLVQWIASERAGRSVIPVSFWLLSILGGGMTLTYGRNLVPIARTRQTQGR